MSAHRKTNTSYARAKDDREKRADGYREPRKRRENNQNTKKDECAGAGHISSISGCHDDDKFATNSVRMVDKMNAQFSWRTGDDFFVDLGELAGDDDSRYF